MPWHPILTPLRCQLLLALCIGIAGANGGTAAPPVVQQAYLKSFNAGDSHYFGSSVGFSGDTVVIGAVGETSDAQGISGTHTNSGAAYVFVRSGTTWVQQAYLKASNAEAGDNFGHSVAISGDTIVIGAIGESSSTVGVNGNQADNSATNAGAAYVFVRNGTNWTQQAYLKASNTRITSEWGYRVDFGFSVAIAGDTIVVGALGEDSSSRGVNGSQASGGLRYAGAAYVFVRNGTNWSQQAYLKSPNTRENERFGWSLAISGETAVVSQSNNSAPRSGAAYVFVPHGNSWIQQAYIKSSNSEGGSPGDGDHFGYFLAVSNSRIVIAAIAEDSGANSINGNQSDNSVNGAGAAYVFDVLPRLVITSHPNGGYLIQANGNASELYLLKRSTAITGPWETVSQQLASSSGLIEYHDSTPLSGQAFYQAVQPLTHSSAGDENE